MDAKGTHLYSLMRSSAASEVCDKYSIKQELFRENNCELRLTSLDHSGLKKKALSKILLGAKAFDNFGKIAFLILKMRSDFLIFCRVFER